MRQTLSKTFANSLNMQKQLEKMLGKRVLVVDKSTYHEKPHFDLFFTAISTSKKMFFLERELKKALRDTLTRAAWSRLFFTTIAANVAI